MTAIPSSAPAGLDAARHIHKKQKTGQVTSAGPPLESDEELDEDGSGGMQIPMHQDESSSSDDSESDDEGPGGQVESENESEEDDDSTSPSPAPPAAAAPPSSSSLAAKQTRTLRFRNYTPHDPSLKVKKIEPVDFSKDNEWMDAELRDIIASALKDDDESVLLNIAPRSLNWDLKRDLAPKLQQLNKMTQKKIREIIRAEIEAQKKAEGEESSSESESSDEGSSSSSSSSEDEEEQMEAGQ